MALVVGNRVGNNTVVAAIAADNVVAMDNRGVVGTDAAVGSTVAVVAIVVAVDTAA